jgi:four helix bundle protein
MAYQNFQELPIWQESVTLAAQIYRYFETTELKRDFRMRDQVRAAAVSIVSNIAEGFEYRNDKQFIRYLTYSKGSVGELISQLYILHEADMIPEKDHRYFQEKALELGRKIGGFIKYLQSDN